MAEVLAWPLLFDAVTAQFIADGTAAPNLFGWREPAKQLVAPNRNRISWVPGNALGAGDAGKILPPKYPGRNPRSLGTLGELFTIYIEAQDPTAPENERAQYTVTRLLFDAWFRAMYLAAHGTFAIQSLQWLGPKERKHGGCLVALVALEAMIPDVVTLVAETPVSANLTAAIGASSDPAVHVTPRSTPTLTEEPST